MKSQVAKQHKKKRNEDRSRIWETKQAKLEMKAIKFLIEDTKKNDIVNSLIFSSCGYCAQGLERCHNVHNIREKIRKHS